MHGDRRRLAPERARGHGDEPDARTEISLLAGAVPFTGSYPYSQWSHFLHSGLLTCCGAVACTTRMKA
jgi:hypothetical protein